MQRVLVTDMSKKKVVLIGTLPPPVGGVSVHLSRFMGRARGGRHDVSLIDIKKMQFVEADRTTEGVAVVLRAFASADVVHIHVSNNIKLLLALISKCFLKKVIYTHHNNIVKNKYIFKLMCLFSDSVIFVNEKCIPASVRNEAGKENWFVIPAFIFPVDIPRLPDWLYKKLQGFESVFCFNASTRSMIDGREVYGVDLVLEVFKSLISSGEIKQFCFVFLDPSSSHRDQVKNFLSSKGLCSDSFIYVDAPDISYSALLKASTISLRPTRTDGDSLSVRESIALGVPVIASDVVSRPNGSIVFRTDSADDLKEKLVGTASVKQHAVEANDFFLQVLELYDRI